MSDLRLDLGCGRQKVEGYIGIDNNPKSAPDILWDLNRGLPKHTWQRTPNGKFEPSDHYKAFDDNSVDEIRSHHCFEHIRVENFVGLMDELWDALKPNGILKVYVPNAECPRAAWGDPGHVRAFSVLTFGYFTRENLVAFPITDKPWKILEGYPKVNGSEGDWWEIEVQMTPDKD